MTRHHVQALDRGSRSGWPSLPARARSIVVAGALVLATAVPGAAPVAANTRDTAADTPVECPPTTPASAITAGMMATGWTVVRGTEPRPFGVEILGVYPDAIGGGHDLILFRAFDVDGASFIERYGGLWAGMSGSPVYLDGKLIGAVSYGFSDAPSTIGGITPIADMLAVSARLGATAGSRGTVSRVSAGVRRAVASADPSAEADRFKALRTPAQLSRIDVPRLRASAAINARNRRWLHAAPIAGVVSLGGNARVRVGPATTRQRPVAGGNLVAAASTGRISNFGLGTTTWVCGDRLLAFGHAFAWRGRVGYAMLTADAFDIVDDSAAGSYKLAVPTGLLGQVKQDRQAAIAGRLDAVPVPVMTVRTRYTEGETSLVGTTQIYPGLESGWRLDVAYATGASVLLDGADQSSVTGTLRFTTTVQGRRADGTPYTATFADRLWGDPSYPGTPFSTAEDIAGIVVAFPAVWLLANPWEQVTVDAVTTTLDRAPVARWFLERVEARVNGGAWHTGSVRARAGDRLDIRVTLAGLTGLATEPAPGATRTTRTASVTVTGDMVGRTVTPTVRSTFLERLIWSGPWQESSLDEYLAALDHQSREDQVDLVLGSRTLATLTTGRIVEGELDGVRILR